jgi:hypothetical protein
VWCAPWRDTLPNRDCKIVPPMTLSRAMMRPSEARCTRIVAWLGGKAKTPWVRGRGRALGMGGRGSRAEKISDRGRGGLTYAATCSAVRGGPSYWCGLVSDSWVEGRAGLVTPAMKGGPTKWPRGKLDETARGRIREGQSLRWSGVLLPLVLSRSELKLGRGSTPPRPGKDNSPGSRQKLMAICGD